MFDNFPDQSGPGWTLHHAECVERMRAMADNSVDAILTDPPYHLTSIKARYGTNETRARNRSDAMARLSGGFMGKTWDGGDVAFRVETWQAAYRVLKPGGYIMAFASSRGYHRMAVAIEDAGFITHPMIGWVFGSGFPKATDASRMIDQALGAVREKIRVDAAYLKNPPNLVGGVGKGGDRPWRLEAIERGFHEKNADTPATPEAEQWQGWYYGGQARKPALEPICVAQKPFSERNGALNILRWGVGAVNIDGCRVGECGARNNGRQAGTNGIYGHIGSTERVDYNMGRWPANLMHDGSDEVLALFPNAPGQNAARFFECYPPVITYCPKASARDRLGSRHPTVKPMALMRSMVRHVCPPGGVVLDPFAGTGTTLRAAVLEGVNAIGIEADAASVIDTVWRMRHATQPE